MNRKKIIGEEDKVDNESEATVYIIPAYTQSQHRPIIDKNHHIITNGASTLCDSEILQVVCYIQRTVL